MHLTVVGGGTATNGLVGVYGRLTQDVSYIVPISDNGGSTSEILRMIGGPAIGDARSRMTRLMPPSPLRQLLEFRLPEDSARASQCWNTFVDGTHPLWQGIPIHVKNMYRAFFIHVHSELLKRSRPGAEFNFTHASIGNLLLSGARIFFGSLDSAIEFTLRTSRVPDCLEVLPALNSNFSHHIAAILADDSTVVGQNEISHPSTMPSPAHTGPIGTPMPEIVVDDISDPHEDANIPFSHPALSASQISFSKDARPLASPIDRLFYVNMYGVEIKPRASSRVLDALKRADSLIYSVGSLYTSIVPVLILQGFGRRVASATYPKIMLINGTPDRETQGMNGYDHVAAVVSACAYSIGLNAGVTGCVDRIAWTDFVTHVIYGSEELVPVDVEALREKNIECIAAPSVDGRYDLAKLGGKLAHILSRRDARHRSRTPANA